MRKTETCHFWLGCFENAQRVAAYFAEVYGEEDAEGEETPLSQFARDQGETWYDHDFLEHGFGEGCETVEDLARGYSYREQWTAELARRAKEAGLTGLNTIVFVSQDQITEARSAQGEGYRLWYLGLIRYRI